MPKAYNTPSNQTTTNNSNDNDASLSAILASHLQHHGPPSQSMDGRQPDYPQSGLSSSYAPYNGHRSERSSADLPSAVQYQTSGPDYKPSTFHSTATPESGYGLPQSARSGSFPEYIQRSYASEGQQQPPPAPPPPQAQPPPPQQQSQQQSQPPPQQQQSQPPLPPPPPPPPQQQRYSAGAQQSGMAQTSNSSIPQSSPTYPPQHNCSPYPPQHDMQQYPGQPMTSYGRPEWAGQYQQPLAYGHSSVTTGGGAPNMTAHAMPRPPAGGHPLSTVYSFVPIPGAQQHKRPRRRYEEIERMYKCGWNGCEKAYGTLNHLNAHVTMQSHGTKRTPEEFKEIRKEWKVKKKEEENQRKAEEERQRQEAARSGQDSSQAPGQTGPYQQHIMQPQMCGPQLPPIGYQPAGGQAPGQYAQPQQVDGAQQYGNNTQMYGAPGYPQSPYGQGGLPYQQRV